MAADLAIARLLLIVSINFKLFWMFTHSSVKNNTSVNSVKRISYIIINKEAFKHTRVSFFQNYENG